MRSKVINMCYITSLSFMIIGGLYLTRKKEFDFGFKRVYLSAPVLKRKVALQTSPISTFKLNNSHIFTYEQYENVIIEFDSSGKYINKFGGSGMAPGEFQLVISFDVDSSYIYTFDPRNRRRTSINYRTGKLVTDTLLPFRRAQQISKSEVIFSTYNDNHQDLSFLKSNLYTHTADTIITTLPIINDGGFANDGFYSTNKKDRIGYFLYHLGKFIILDSSGHLTYAAKTIDHYDKLPITIKQGDKITLSQKSLTVTKSATLNEKYIFIVSNIKSSNDIPISHTEYIDIYNLINGTYIGSLYLSNLPNPIANIEADSENIYLGCGNTIFEYKIQLN